MPRILFISRCASDVIKVSICRCPDLSCRLMLHHCATTEQPPVSTTLCTAHMAATQYTYVSSEACQSEYFISQERNMVSHSDYNCLEDIAVM